MGFFDSVKEAFGLTEPEKAQVARAVSIPIQKEDASSIKGFNHSMEWVCKCGAKLKVRSREPRADGPSNFHPKLGAGDLNWNGLAVERGWTVEPAVICPACWRGQSMAEYKAQRAGK